jgi:plastocyanin
MKNLNIVIIIGAVVLLGGLMFASSLLKTSNKENKNPQVLAPDQTNSQLQNNLEEPIVAKVQIEMTNFTFEPNVLTVKPGEIITVTNRDTVKHTLTSNVNLFKTNLLGKEDSAEIKAPLEPGKYLYHCEPHPNMVGTIIVQE